MEPEAVSRGIRQEEEGTEGKERRGLTGSPGVPNALGTVCKYPDEDGFLFIGIIS